MIRFYNLDSFQDCVTNPGSITMANVGSFRTEKSPYLGKLLKTFAKNDRLMAISSVFITKSTMRLCLKWLLHSLGSGCKSKVKTTTNGLMGVASTTTIGKTASLTTLRSNNVQP